MNHEQYLNSESSLRMAPPIFQPRPRHQMRPPLGMFDEFHPLVTNRMYFPFASSVAIPPPHLNDFSTSFPMGASPSYGMLPFPSQDPSRRPYLHPTDFGYSFPGGAFFPPTHPPPSLRNAFLPPRQQDDDHHHHHHHRDAALNVQYQAHMTALQSHVDSFLHSLQTPENRGKSKSKNGSIGRSPSTANGFETALCHNADASKLKLASRIPALPKLHAGLHHLPSSQSSILGPPPSGDFSGIPLPPLHFPSFKPPMLSNPPLQTGENEKRQNARELKVLEKDSLQHRVVEDASDDQATAVKIPKLPPLLIGNRDLARKLSEEQHGCQRPPGFQSTAGNFHSGPRRPEHDDNALQINGCKQRHNEITEVDDSFSRNLPVPGGNWVEDTSANTGGKPYCLPRLTNDLSDIEVMREAYSLENFHLRQFSPVSSSGVATVAKHSAAFNFTSTPVPATKRQQRSSPPSPGMLPSARPGNQSFPHPAPLRKELVRQLSDSIRLSGVANSEQPGCPISIAAAPVVSALLGSSYGELCTEKSKLASSSDVTDCGSREVSAAIHIKQEVSDEVLDFTVSSSVNPSIDAQEDDRAVDLAALGSREVAQPSEILPQECLDGRWIPPDAEVADQNASDKIGFQTPLEPSIELDYSNMKSCQNAFTSGAMANNIGDDRNGEFRCHLCNYSGRSQHCLSKHFRAHSQACKICRYCMKAFERPSDLVRHEERHQKRNHVVLTTPGRSAPHRADPASNKSTKKRRTPWFCHQCDFSCHEARKLIVHTRKMHPIQFECKLCHAKLTSEAELSAHKTARHPVALGRLDTYWRGVVTSTKLVTCEITNDQEISISFDEILELPLKTDGIPEVSNLYEAKRILGKNSRDNFSLAKGFVMSPRDGNLVHEESRTTTGSANVQEESPIDKCRNSLEFDCNADILDLSVTSTLYSLQGASTGPPVIGDTTEVEQIRTQSSAPDCLEICDPEDLTLPSKQTSLSYVKSFELTKNGDHDKNCLPKPAVSTETNNSLEILKDLSHQMPLTLTKQSINSKCKPAKLIGKVPAKKPSKEDTTCSEKIKTFPKKIKTETVENSAVGETVSPTFVSEDIANVNCTNEIVLGDKISKTEASDTPETTDEVGIALNKASEIDDSFYKKFSTFICIRCKYSTNSKFKYQQHLKAHNGRFICKRCNKACIKSSDLYRHWVTHNVKGPNGYFACDSCDFTSPQKYAVENHMKQHYMINPAQPRHQLSLMSRCGICQKNVLRSRLFEHKRVVHGKFFLKPQNGGGTDANGNSIKIPPKTFVCPQCDRRFTTPSYLLRHHFLHHQEADPSARTKTEENVCSCRFCGIKFDDVDLLQQHEIGHILQTCSDVDYAKRLGKRKRNPLDSVKTNTMSSDVKHDLSKSQKKRCPRRKLSCPLCSKHFKMQYFLDQHMRVHGDERPFVCQWCGAGFAIFQYLNIHRRFKCPNRTAETLEPLDAVKDCNNGEVNFSLDHSGELLNQTCN